MHKIKDAIIYLSFLARLISIQIDYIIYINHMMVKEARDINICFSS